MRIELNFQSACGPVSAKLADGTEAPTGLCSLHPEPLVGMNVLAVGKLYAIGNGGRKVEADLVFDLRKSAFAVRPKKLEPAGFAFDLPEDANTPATTTPEQAVTAATAVAAVPQKPGAKS
jgi:hypothetical protein